MDNVELNCVEGEVEVPLTWAPSHGTIFNGNLPVQTLNNIVGLTETPSPGVYTNPDDPGGTITVHANGKITLTPSSTKV
jgi:hypothetical protein